MVSAAYHVDCTFNDAQNRINKPYETHIFPGKECGTL